MQRRASSPQRATICNSRSRPRLYVDQAFAPAEPERRDRAIAGARRAFASIEALLRTMLDLLRRALGDLVANALRHGHGTRVLIAARRRARGWVELWVIDNGRGIAAEESERVFEDYTQGASDTRGAGGFGIVLSSARRMIALQGGTIALDARWTGGAAFVIRLRAAEPCAGAEDRCEAA